MKSIARHAAFAGLALVTLIALGCNESVDSGGPSEMDRLAGMLDKPNEAPPAPAPSARPVEPEPTPPVATTPPSDGSGSAAKSTEPERRISHVKSGGNRAGTVGQRKYRNEVNGPLQYYGAMATVRVLAEDRALGWQIKKSMDVYLALHDNEYPKDLDEYMREIIEPNMIELPELEQGQEFYYDPQDHELKIVVRMEDPAEDGAAETAPAQ